ncbi:hypothetical protein ABMB67_000481 [Halalkalibacter oceani]
MTWTKRLFFYLLVQSLSNERNRHDLFKARCEWVSHNGLVACEAIAMSQALVANEAIATPC